jgi:predicted nucleotidyltransferase
MTEKETIILNKFKSLLLERIFIHNLVLFGSRARGDASEESDLDIIVITDTLNKEIEDYISDCAWEAGIDEGIVVCPISYSKNEWESNVVQQSPFAKSITEYGLYL